MNHRRSALALPLLAILGWTAPARALGPATPAGVISPQEALPRPGAAASAAWEALLEHRAALACEPSWLRMGAVHALGTPRAGGYGERGATVRFEQHAGGLKVEGAGVAVWLAPDGRLLRLTHFTVTPPATTTPTLPPTQASSLALARLGTQGPAAVQLVLKATAGQAELLWEVTPDALAGARVGYVDAHSGAWRGEEDRWVMADLPADVYPRNPYLDPEVQRVDLSPWSDGDLSTDTFSVYNCLDQGEMASYKDVDGVTWPSHVCTLEAAPEPGEDGLVYGAVAYPEEPARDEDLFAGPHTFYHVNRAFDFFKALGVGSLDGQPVTVITNVRWPNAVDEEALVDPEGLLMPLDNAYYSPPYTSSNGTRYAAGLVFGQGSLSDFSYDADVVYHEFTHAVVQTLEGPRGSFLDVNGTSVEPSALNEGLADYFSSAMMDEGTVGEYAALRWSPEGEGIRDLDVVARCPDDIIGEPHQDSLPFSSALWSVRQLLPTAQRRDLDAAVYDALTQMSSTTTLTQASEGVLEVVRRSLGEDVGADLEAALGLRGLPGCERVIDVAQAQAESDYALTYTAIAGMSTVGSDDPIPAPVQLRVDVPPGTRQVMVHFLLARFKGVQLTAYGYNREVQPTGVLFQPNVPILHAYNKIEGTWDILSSAPLVAQAEPELDEEVLVGSRYEYVPYWARWPVESEGPHLLQLVNMGAGSSWIYNVQVQVSEEPFDPGCNTAPGGQLTLWGVVLLVLGRARRR